MKNLTNFGLVLLCTLFIFACGKEDQSLDITDQETETRLYPWDVVNPAGLEFEIWQGGMVWGCDYSIGSNVWAATQEECECELNRRMENCQAIQGDDPECCQLTTPCFQTSSRYPPKSYEGC